MHGFDAQNFVCTIVESQLTGQLTDTAGDPTPAALLLNALDKAFTAIFTVELAVNMASNLWTRFVHDPWCLLSCSLPLPLCFLSLSSVLPPFYSCNHFSSSSPTLIFSLILSLPPSPWPFL